MTFKLIEKTALWITISTLVIGVGFVLMGVSALQHKPFLNFGIDFTGGSSFMFKLEDSKTLARPELEIIKESREVLDSFGLSKSQIQITKEHELIVRTTELDNQQRLRMFDTLKEKLGEIELLEADIIGPTIGEELKSKSLSIILIVSIALLLYITLRFEFRFGASALVAVLHDAFVILSMAAILNIEINTAFVAALLTILGYSINDTIVIFDRIREWLTNDTKFNSLPSLMNSAVQSMLGRSFHTSVTTLLVIGSLLIFGGTTIKSFCLVLVIGIISGTYSSIFIATPVLAFLMKGKE